MLSDASSEAYLGNWLGFLDYLCSCLTDLDKAALAGGPTVNLLKSKDQRDITEHRRNHAVGETTKWMQDAGFTDVAFSPMSLLNSNGYICGYRR